MSQREAIERIDKFIKDLDNRDITLIPEKLTAHWGIETKGFLGRKSFDSHGTIADMLAKYLALYQQAKNSTDVYVRMEVIDQALRFINLAYTKNAVKPSDGIYRKHDEAQDEVSRLKKELLEKQDELQQVSSELLESEAERKSLKRQLDEILKK